MSSRSQRTVRLISLPQRVALEAAHDVGIGGRRELVIVELTDVDAGVSGWGECAAMNQPGYTSEWSRGAYEVLAGGETIDAAQHPLAAAAIEMARIDLDLRQRARSLLDDLGFDSGPVMAGATIGLGSSATVMARADELAAAGYRRLKLKIAPRHDLDIVEMVARAHPDVELHVDANGSFSSDSVDRLAALDPRVAVIEQPFAVDDLDSSARLRRRTEAKVMADEGARPIDRLDRLVASRAIDGVVVKPGCLGGIRSAMATIGRCAELGLDVSVGGMIESALGRHVLAALANHPGVTVVGDISPASLWLIQDPWPDVEMSSGHVSAHLGAGVAPEPDRAALDRGTLTMSRWSE